MKNISLVCTVTLLLAATACSKTKSEMQPKLGSGPRSPLNQNIAAPQMPMVIGGAQELNMQPMNGQMPAASATGYPTAPMAGMPIQPQQPDFMNGQGMAPTMPNMPADNSMMMNGAMSPDAMANNLGSAPMVPSYAQTQVTQPMQMQPVGMNDPMNSPVAMQQPAPQFVPPQQMMTAPSMPMQPVAQPMAPAPMQQQMEYAQSAPAPVMTAPANMLPASLRPGYNNPLVYVGNANTAPAPVMQNMAPVNNMPASINRTPLNQGSPATVPGATPDHKLAASNITNPEAAPTSPVGGLEKVTTQVEQTQEKRVVRP